MLCRTKHKKMNLLTLLQSGLHNDDPIIRRRKSLHFTAQHRLSLNSTSTLYVWMLGSKLFWSLCAQKNLKNADNFSGWKRESMILFDTKFDYKIRPLWKWDHTYTMKNFWNVSEPVCHQTISWILEYSNSVTRVTEFEFKTMGMHDVMNIKKKFF